MATKKPDSLSRAASLMAPRIRLMRDIYGGTETMRAAREAYLPQYDKETDPRYESRLASTFALNKLREAVEAASAKPFRSQIKVLSEDQDLQLMLQDVDLRGTHIHLFAHKFFNEALLVGQSHILIDHPDTSKLPNLAAQKASNARPFWKHIKTDDLIAAYTEFSGGDVRVYHARIRSSRTTIDPESYKEVRINQIYVIEVEPGTENGVVQLYEQAASGGDWVLIGETKLQMREVPLVTLYAGDQEEDFVTKPVFQDLAYKQIEHWISSSDQRAILAAGRFPMLACSGVELAADDQTSGIEIGPWKVLYSPDAQGRWYYVEPDGHAIESGFKDIGMLEMHMDMMALNPVMATHRQYVPQNERDIAETRVHSVVHDLALSCKDALERAIGFMGMWNGREEEYSQVAVDMNLDFTNSKDKAKQMALLITSWEKRGITRKTFLEEAKRLDMLSAEVDVEAELALLDEQDQRDMQMNAAGKSTTGGERGPDQSAASSSGVDFGTGSERPTKII